MTSSVLRTTKAHSKSSIIEDDETDSIQTFLRNDMDYLNLWEFQIVFRLFFSVGDVQICHLYAVIERAIFFAGVNNIKFKEIS